MKKIYTLTLGLLILLSLTACATAAPVEHKATGGGYVMMPYDEGEQKLTVAFTALMLDAEGSAKGNILIQTSGTMAMADVYEMHMISDNAAIIFAEIIKSNDPTIPIGQPFPMIVVDNGEGNDAVDLFMGLLPFYGNIDVK